MQILRAFAGSWSDPIRGKELALAQYDQGVSIIANVGSRTGLGIFEAAVERGRFVVGVDMNQDNLAPGHVLTSMLKHIDVAVYTVIESLVKGNFRGGEYMYMDLAANGIGLTDFSVMRAHLGPLFPQDIVNAVEDLSRRIVSGEIRVNTFPGIRPWEG
jgi:basic membrane protein A